MIRRYYSIMQIMTSHPHLYSSTKKINKTTNTIKNVQKPMAVTNKKIAEAIVESIKFR